MTTELSTGKTNSAADWLAVEQLVSQPIIPGLVGGSAAIKTVATTIARLAPHKATVMILGESGTGKEVVAEALHRLGPSSNAPLIRFNCSNLVKGLAESQLFGHVRGAFTDAREAYNGCFRQANGGTLFLDEIGELPLQMQSKMLRAVENLEVQAVGSSETYRLDLRLLVATNRDLRAMVTTGEFRADLFYRLNAAPIHLAPLRDRVEDTAALSGHFIAHYNRSFGKHVRHISREALELMRNYGWPGNVRELAHTIEHAALMCGNDRIGAADLPSDLIAEATARITAGGRESITSGSGIASLSALIATNLSMPANITLDQAMKSAVARSLAAARGDCARAARSLGISRPSIYRKMARYGLQSSGAGIVNAEGAAIQLKPPDNADDR